MWVYVLSLRYFKMKKKMYLDAKIKDYFSERELGEQ